MPEETIFKQIHEFKEHNDVNTGNMDLVITNLRLLKRLRTVIADEVDKALKTRGDHSLEYPKNFSLSRKEAAEYLENSLSKKETAEYLENFLSRKEAAALLKVSLPTLNKYTKAGKVKGYKLGRSVKYKIQDLENCFIQIKN